jgi:hypothetical protein
MLSEWAAKQLQRCVEQCQKRHETCRFEHCCGATNVAQRTLHVYAGVATAVGTLARKRLVHSLSVRTRCLPDSARAAVKQKNAKEHVQMKTLHL